MIAAGIWKPWYLYQPRQILRRMIGIGDVPSSDYLPLRAAWGIEMLACPTEHIGQCLRTTGVYDLAVSEVMFRLVHRGDIVLDAGANIGYMTLLAAVAAGTEGTVMAFEPNPHLFPILSKNVAAAQHHLERMAAVELHQAALGAYRHRTALVLSDPAASNDGLSYIPANPVSSDGGVDTVNIQVETLDGVLDGRTVGLAKVDVEGHERQLFEGAAVALGSHRIRHLVFEDHQGTGSAASALLAAAGYTLFSIGWSMRRPLLAEVRRNHTLSRSYEAPSYLATVEPEYALSACRPSGWRALRRQIQWQ